ncbi:uncharacterized protein FRV6_16488 [Fusarium oxysporum]|uniref:Uncharacterized protein n=1 Tax=Fusarium oxysporum TaxID=5507 RepID=A0A2H3U619_FUSOX|nr:uncharacterized protein FRV6_16488 [Fusarium oxysporum]
MKINSVLVFRGSMIISPIPPGLSSLKTEVASGAHPPVPICFSPPQVYWASLASHEYQDALFPPSL